MKLIPSEIRSFYVFPEGQQGRDLLHCSEAIILGQLYRWQGNALWPFLASYMLQITPHGWPIQIRTVAEGRRGLSLSPCHFPELKWPRYNYCLRRDMGHAFNYIWARKKQLKYTVFFSQLYIWVAAQLFKIAEPSPPNPSHQIAKLKGV